MTDGGRHHDRSDAPGRGPAGVPWWIGDRVRLPLLLICLGITVIALLTSHTSILAAGSRGSSASRPDWCVPVAPPPLQSVSWRQLVSLRASVLGVMAPLSRSRYAWGSVPAEVVWTDDSPQAIRASESDGLWRGSFEMRSWVTDPQLAPEQDDIVADVFVFADSAEARRFFAEASGTRCHRDGSEQPASRPPGARDLVWVNPDGPVQENVTVLRGPRVYRIGDVRPSVASSLAAHEAGIARVDMLACELPDARCPRPPD